MPLLLPLQADLGAKFLPLLLLHLLVVLHLLVLQFLLPLLFLLPVKRNHLPWPVQLYRICLIRFGKPVATISLILPLILVLLPLIPHLTHAGFAVDLSILMDLPVFVPCQLRICTGIVTP